MCLDVCVCLGVYELCESYRGYPRDAVCWNMCGCCTADSSTGEANSTFTFESVLPPK